MLKPNDTQKRILELNLPYTVRFEPLKEKRGRLQDPPAAPWQEILVLCREAFSRHVALVSQEEDAPMRSSL